MPPEKRRKMGLKHKVTINVIKSGGICDPVGIIVITFGDSVETVEIKEIREGGAEHEQNQATYGCSF